MARHRVLVVARATAIALGALALGACGSPTPRAPEPVRDGAASRSPSAPSTPVDPARASIEAAYRTHCIACHGAELRGAPQVPDLRDTVWYWGSTAEQIAQTLRHGIRTSDPATRAGIMPGFRTNAAEFGPRDVADLTEYVLSLSGAQVDAAAAARGKENWVWCTDCHAEDGSGKPELGAPSLRDAEWLYGSTREQIAHAIAEGTAGQCPAWGPVLGAELIEAIARDLSRAVAPPADPSSIGSAPTGAEHAAAARADGT